MTDQPVRPDALDRLFARLVVAVRDQRPEYLAAAFDVGELIQFVPYKLVRADIGVDTNDDYGHAMMRLLAGERSLVFADDLMQDDLQAELKSPNPDVQAYRAYLASRITLAQERVREVLDAATPPEAREAVLAGAAAPTAKPAALPASKPPAPKAPAAPITAKPRPLPSATAPVAAAADSRHSRPGCKYCGQPLPQGRDVRFCPHCGQDLAMRRCGGCSAEVEPDWKFCVTCGRATNA